MKIRSLSFLFLLLPITCFSDVYDYANYLQDLKTATNSVKQVTNQATEINNQLQMLRNEAQNLKKVPQYQWRNISTLINQLNATTQQGMAISYSMRDLDARFRSTYTDYENTPVPHMDYSKAYQQWSGTTLDTFRNTMETMGTVSGNFNDEETMLQSLKMQGETATGRMQALQVSSEIASENVNQLQELKHIVIAQNNSTNAYMSYQVSKDAFQEKSMEKVVNNIDTTYPSYQNNKSFGDITMGGQ